MTRRIPEFRLTKANLVLVCGMLLWTCDDAAARGPGGGRSQRQAFAHVAQVDARAMHQAERAAQRGGQGRGQRREAPTQQPAAPAAPAYQPPEPPPQARPGRLTPDERRALRQQINEAGRDVYQPR